MVRIFGLMLGSFPKSRKVRLRKVTGVYRQNGVVILCKINVNLRLPNGAVTSL
jgi:hypothetical protein